MPEAGTLMKMSDELTQPDPQTGIGLLPDFLGEDRHEFIEKLAYQYWEARGRPIGSPQVDWFQAERDFYASMKAYGLVSPCADDKRQMREKIYR